MLGLLWNVAVLPFFACLPLDRKMAKETQIAPAKEAQIQVPISLGCFSLLSSTTKGIVQRHFPQLKCKNCVCYPWIAMIKAAVINSNEYKPARFLFPTLPMTVWYCPFAFVFFNHLNQIWFEKCFYLYTKGKQCNIYGKPFHLVYIAHHWVVQYKILSAHRYILIIIFGAFRWRMTKTGLLSQY